MKRVHKWPLKDPLCRCGVLWGSDGVWAPLSLCFSVSVCLSLSLSLSHLLHGDWWLTLCCPNLKGLGCWSVTTGKLHIARCIFSYRWLYFLLSPHTLAAGSPSTCLSALFNPHLGRQKNHNNRISRAGLCFPLRPHLCLWPPGRWATQLFTSHSSGSWMHAYSGLWCVWGRGRKNHGKWKSVFSETSESCSSGVCFWSIKL